MKGDDSVKSSKTSIFHSLQTRRDCDPAQHELVASACVQLFQLLTVRSVSQLKQRLYIGLCLKAPSKFILTTMLRVSFRNLPGPHRFLFRCGQEIPSFLCSQLACLAEILCLRIIFKGD